METRVFGFTNDPKPWTNPFPERDTEDGIPGANGFIWAMRGGHMISPSGWQPRPETTSGASQTFFNSIPATVRRLYFWFPILPFVAFRKGKYGGYLGFKCFGVDSDAYKDYPGVNPAEVRDGNLALSGFTARFTNKLRLEV